MKILIIDNGTRYLDNLLNLLKAYQVEIRTPDCQPEIRDVLGPGAGLGIMSQPDLIILTGGHSYSIVNHRELYRQEIQLIKTTSLPLIGICLGCELIAFAFGARLERLEIKKKGILSLEIVRKDPIFKNLPSFEVYESHRWVIREVPGDLVGLAKSKDGYEVIRHQTRPIVGFQFHPEMVVARTCGDEIFANAVNYLTAGLS